MHHPDPTITMTVNAVDADKLNTHTTGMNTTIAKPIGIRKLRKTLPGHFM